MEITPTLIIGLGGTGLYGVSEIKKTITTRYLGGRPNFPLVSYYCIDTEFLDIEEKKKLNEKLDGRLEFEVTFDESNITQMERYEAGVDPASVKGWLEKPQGLGAEDFVHEQAGEVIDARGDGASGFGLVGKMALVSKFGEIAQNLRSRITGLTNIQKIQTTLGENPQFAQFSSGDRFNVYIVCSFGGGTGKGMVLTMAALVRELLLSIFHNRAHMCRINIVNYLPSCFRAKGRSIAENPAVYKYILANQYAAFKELDWCYAYGYRNENFFKRYFNHDVQLERHTEDIISTVFNISNQLQSKKTIGDYATINRSVAETIAFMIFNPSSNSILKSISNAPRLQELAIPERDTGLKRTPGYTRIARYSLRFPEDQLFDYAESYFSHEIVLDILNGKLSPKPFESVPQTPGAYHPEKRASGFFDKINSEFQQRFAGISQISLQIEDLMFPPITDSLNIKIVLDAVKQQMFLFDSTANAFKHSDFKDIFSDRMDVLLRSGVKDSGLLYIKSFLEELNERFENEIDQLLKGVSDENFIDVEELLNAHVRDDATDRYERFNYGVARGVLKTVKEKLETHFSEARTFQESSKYADATGVVDGIVKARNKEKKKVLKKVTKIITSGIVEPIPMPQESKQLIQRELDNFNQIIRACTPLYRLENFLEFSIDFNEVIERRLEKINENIVTLKAKDAYNRETGLLNDFYLERVEKGLNKSSALETNVIGRNQKDFDMFCEIVLPGKQITDNIQADLNDGFMNGLTDKKIPSDKFKEEIRKAVKKELSKERFSVTDDINIKCHTMMSYLRWLELSPDQNTKQQVPENLKRLNNATEFLGAIDTNAFIDPGNASQGFQTHSFIELEDPSFAQRQHNFDDYTYHANVIPQEDHERITLTRVQGLIPLFSFEELREAQKEYQAYLEGQTGESQSVDQRTRGLIISHTSKYFMESIDEPFGSSLQLDQKHIHHFINMAYHAGVIKYSKNGHIQLLKNPSGRTGYVSYEDKSKTQYARVDFRFVFLTTYADNFSDHFKLTQDIVEMLAKRFNILAEDADEGQLYLRNYVGNPYFPMVVPQIYDKLLKISQQQAEYSLLNQFLQQHREDYHTQFHRHFTEYENVDLAKNDQELQETYPDAEQQHELFLQLTKFVDPKYEGITGSSHWWLIYGKNKNKPIDGTQFGNYEEAYAGYQDRLKRGVFKRGAVVNFYSPPPADRILTIKEFEKLWGDKLPITGGGMFLVWVNHAQANMDTRTVVEALKTNPDLLIYDEGKKQWVGWREVPEIVQGNTPTPSVSDKIPLPPGAGPVPPPPPACMPEKEYWVWDNTMQTLMKLGSIVEAIRTNPIIQVHDELKGQWVSWREMPEIVEASQPKPPPPPPACTPEKEYWVWANNKQTLIKLGAIVEAIRTNPILQVHDELKGQWVSWREMPEIVEASQSKLSPSGAGPIPPPPGSA